MIQSNGFVDDKLKLQIKYLPSLHLSHWVYYYHMFLECHLHTLDIFQEPNHKDKNSMMKKELTEIK